MSSNTTNPAPENDDRYCSNENRKRTIRTAAGNSTIINHQHEEKRTKTDDDTKDNNDDPSCWTEEDHYAFVSGIFDIGMKHSSPSVIQDNMTIKSDNITSERVKSHLQKYRANKQKSKEEFLNSYTMWISKALAFGGGSPLVVKSMINSGKLSCGEIAAFLTYSTMIKEREGERGETINNQRSLHNNSLGLAKFDASSSPMFAAEAARNGGQQISVSFPQLTEDEKKTALGESMCYVMGLVSSLSRHILRERSRERESSSSSSGNKATVGENNKMTTTAAEDVVNHRDNNEGVLSLAAAAAASASSSFVGGVPSAENVVKDAPTTTPSRINNKQHVHMTTAVATSATTMTEEEEEEEKEETTALL